MLPLVLFFGYLIHISRSARLIRQEYKLLQILHSKTKLLMSKPDNQRENFESISLLELKNSITCEQLSILQNSQEVLNLGPLFRV